MSKALKPGYLYILNDSDQRSGTSSPYYKIGITFESKTVEDRIKEHQTGNPRDVVCVFALRTEAPFLIEQSLHRVHSTKRIRLEWFEFNDKELKDLKNEVKKLDALFAPKVKQIRDYALKDSNGKNAVLSKADQADAELIHQELLVLYHDKLERKLKRETITATLKEKTADHGQGIDGVVIVNVKGQGPPKFNATKFKDSSPANLALWNAFQKKSRTDELKVKGKPTPAKNHPTLYKEKQEQLSKAGLVKPEPHLVRDAGITRTTDIEKLHDEYINLLEEEGKLQIQIDDREMRLMMHINEANGIENIANWNRKEETKFDETAFKLAHPALHNDLKYHVQGVSSVSYTIAKSRNYIV